jgi:hypothetical protein
MAFSMRSVGIARFEPVVHAAPFFNRIESNGFHSARRRIESARREAQARAKKNAREYATTPVQLRVVTGFNGSMMTMMI